MKKSQMMPYSIIGIVVLILIFTSVAFNNVDTNTKMEIEVSNLEDSQDEINLNIQRVRRCVDISLKSYLEDLIEHAGFLYDYQDLIDNPLLQDYYDLVDFRSYNGDYYPILVKNLEISVPGYPYNEVGNKHFYYDKILDDFSKDIKTVIELSVEEFFPDIVKRCLEEEISEGIDKNIKTNVNVSFILDQDSYYFETNFNVFYSNNENTDLNYLSFDIRQNIDLYQFINFVGETLNRDSVINENFNLNEDFDNLGSYRAGYDVNSRYDSQGYYLYNYDSKQVIDLDTARMKFFGEDSSPYLVFYDDSKEVMKYIEGGYDFEVLPGTIFRLNMKGFDAQDPNNLKYLVQGFMATSRNKLKIEDCIDNFDDCAHNPIKYVEILENSRTLSVNKFRDGVLELNFTDQDIGPQNVTVLLGDDMNDVTPGIYHGEIDGHMDYRNIKLLVLDSPEIDVFIQNAVDGNFNLSTEDPWVFYMNPVGIFSQFLAQFNDEDGWYDEYHEFEDPISSSEGEIDMNIDVYRFMNNELHSLYKSFNLKLNVSQCTPYRSVDAEYPFNLTSDYNHTSCNDDATFRSEGTVCFYDKKSFNVPKIMGNGFSSELVGNLSNVKDENIDENFYNNLSSIDVYEGSSYNLSNLNDGYEYELSVKTDGISGNKCVGDYDLQVTKKMSCDSFNGVLEDDNVEVFGSCKGYDVSSNSCENLVEPFEKGYISDYLSLSDLSVLNIRYKELLLQGNCSYYSSDDICDNVSCGCSDDGSCNIAQVYYADKDGDLYGDPNDISCRCISEVGYVSGSHKLGDDCYDGSDFGSFFNDDVIWKRVHSETHSGGDIISYSCNLFEEIFVIDDWIYGYNGTNYLICERKNSDLTNFNNIDEHCSII